MTQKSSALPRLAHNEKRVAELARTGERADKVKKIKEQIAAGQFQVDSKEVAKSIARSEVHLAILRQYTFQVVDYLH